MRVLPLLLLPSLALATPSGNRWFLKTCSTSCTLDWDGTPNTNQVCVNGRCLPEVRFAASINNTGGMTLPGLQQLQLPSVLATMRNQFERWKLPNTTCTPSIDFAFETPFYTSPQGAGQNRMSMDGNNNIIWLSGADWRHSPATLGLTTNTWYPNGELSDSDMEMNAATVTWGQGTTISSVDYDWQSVVTHEAGHFIGFAHTLNSVAVMYESIGPGEIKQNLQLPDIQDVCTVYPGAAGSQGSPCSGSGCMAGLVCEGPAATGSRICTRDCATVNDPCPNGFTCQMSTANMACLPRVGATDMCKFCTSGQACTTGVCATDGMGKNFCTMPCNPSIAGQCGPNFSCNQTPAGTYCFPSAGACTNQCTTANAATNCAPGYECRSGTCTPTGKTGDRCEVSEICDPCHACATDETNPQIAFCRACCNGGAPICTGCSSTTCAMVGGQMTTCLPIPQRQEQLCYPSSGSATCQACSAANPCSGGAQCIGGFCRAACNTANPGNCPACQPSTNGGYCACSAQEISDANEPCSSQGAMLAICRNGLSCIANFCRQRCNINDPASCPTGTRCETRDGVQVCIPGNDGTQCNPCGANGFCEAGLTCYANRCYPRCTVTMANQCATCVQTEPDPPQGNGGGVCACPDQIVGPGASCLLPNIASCQPGTRCISGVCEARCDPMNVRSCPIGRVCTAVGGTFYCAPDTSGEGGGSAGGGGGSPTSGGRPPMAGSSGTGGGTGGGTVTTVPCSCSGTEAGPTVLLALSVLAALRRRR